MEDLMERESSRVRGQVNIGDQVDKTSASSRVDRQHQSQLVSTSSRPQTLIVWGVVVTYHVS